MAIFYGSCELYDPKLLKVPGEFKYTTHNSLKSQNFSVLCKVIGQIFSFKKEKTVEFTPFLGFSLEVLQSVVHDSH